MQEQLAASPPRSQRAPQRVQCDGSRVMSSGGGFPGSSAMMARGGAMGGAPDPTSNQTSRDNPFFRGF